MVRYMATPERSPWHAAASAGGGGETGHSRALGKLGCPLSSTLGHSGKLQKQVLPRKEEEEEEHGSRHGSLAPSGSEAVYV